MSIAVGYMSDMLLDIARTISIWPFVVKHLIQFLPSYSKYKKRDVFWDTVYIDYTQIAAPNSNWWRHKFGYSIQYERV